MLNPLQFQKKNAKRFRDRVRVKVLTFSTILEQPPLREVAQHFDLRELPHSESDINVLFGWDCIEEQYPHCETSGRLHFLKRKMTFMIISRFTGIWDFNCAIAIRGTGSRGVSFE